MSVRELGKFCPRCRAYLGKTITCKVPPTGRQRERLNHTSRERHPESKKGEDLSFS